MREKSISWNHFVLPMNYENGFGLQQASFESCMHSGAPKNRMEGQSRQIVSNGSHDRGLPVVFLTPAPYLWKTRLGYLYL